MWTIVAGVISFIAIFVLVAGRVTFGLSVAIGSILLGLLTLSIKDPFRSISGAIINFTTLDLALTVSLIAFLGFMYEHTGKLTEMAQSLEKVVSDPGAKTVELSNRSTGVLQRSESAVSWFPLVGSGLLRRRVFVTPKVLS